MKYFLSTAVSSTVAVSAVLFLLPFTSHAECYTGNIKNLFLKDSKTIVGEAGVSIHGGKTAKRVVKLSDGTYVVLSELDDMTCVVMKIKPNTPVGGYDKK